MSRQTLFLVELAFFLVIYVYLRLSADSPYFRSPKFPGNKILCFHLWIKVSIFYELVIFFVLEFRVIYKKANVQLNIGMMNKSNDGERLNQNLLYSSCSVLLAAWLAGVCPTAGLVGLYFRTVGSVWA